MRPNPFVPALRAELDALVARYEALVLAHEQMIASAQLQQTDQLRAQLLASQTQCEALDRKLAEKTAALTDLEQQLEMQKAAHVSALARANDELRTLQASLDTSNAKAEKAQAALAALDSSTKTFQQAFSQEQSFVEATADLIGAPLLDALQEALGEPLRPEARLYAAIKQRRMDALLLHAMKERGRTVANLALLPSESTALLALAKAAGCELIEAVPGQRFSSSTMDKAASRPDPAEEGNVIATLMPGLRLSGSEGTLLFPRVLVAVG